MMVPCPAAVKFLLVDDREENLLALEALLEREGLVLLKARSGDEALELLLEHDVALALLDVQMPDMDGFALAELMRGAERSRHVPIIFVTADVHERRRVFRGYDAGAVDFLFKPIEPQILRHKADTFIALYRQRQQLAETLRLNEMFMAAVGHDLRNPLNVMMMASQGIDLASTDPEVKKLAGKIHANGKRMAKMIDELSDLARGRLGNGIPLVRKRFDLGAVIRRVLAGYATTHPSRRIDVSHEHLVSGEWDEARIEQLVDNLVANALRHGEAEVPVTICLGLDAEHLVMTVHNGGTIAKDVMPHLFDPFRSSRKSGARSEGLGLGLYIVDSIVRSHGGTIEVTTGDEGTTFRVRLPLRAPSAV